MSLTKTQLEIYQYFASHDFVPPDLIASFRNRLEKDNPTSVRTLSYAMQDFLDDTCPKCKVAGAYKFHFMGKLKHKPGCDWTWYMGPGAYASTQLAKSFRAGMGMGGGMMSDAEKKGESGGCIYAIFGLVFGTLFRLTFAILMIPIQAIVTLTQSKPEADNS
jgi:hypothetical protein